MKRTLLLVLFLPALAAAQEYALLRTTRVGDSISYRVRAELDFVGSTKAVLTGLTTEKVIAVAEGKIKVESLSTEGKVEIEGGPQDIPAQPATTTTYKPTGEIVLIEGVRIKGDSYRISNMGAFRAPEKPVAIGASWTREVAADEKTGAVAAKATFTLEALETIGAIKAARVKYSYLESIERNPAAAEGFMWVSVDDGSLVKSELTVTNAPFPDAPIKINAKLTVQRV